MSYRVFLNAPTAAVLKKKSPEDTFYWRTAKTPEETHSFHVTDLPSKAKCEEVSPLEVATQDDKTQGWLLPPATLGAASQRISEMYKNVIFPEDDREEECARYEETMEDETGVENTPAVSREESLISWPPTNPAQTGSRTSLARALTRSVLETQDDDSENVSYAHTSTSSITAFPTFVINLHTLTNLSDLAAVPAGVRKWTRKVNLLIAILEVDGPDCVKVKRGPDAGREIGVLKLVVGGEEGGICKVTAWREVADAWGGVQEAESDDEGYADNEGVRRGDIVYVENILASSGEPVAAPTTGQRSNGSSVALTASPNLASRLHICYRTLPTTPSDRRFRPDLRLAASDPGLRKVASVVRWLQGMIGLDRS